MDPETTSSKDGLESPVEAQKQSSEDIKQIRKLKIDNVTTDWLLRGIIPYDPGKPWSSKNRTLESKCDLSLAILDLYGLDFEYDHKSYQCPFLDNNPKKTFKIREGSQAWTDWSIYYDHKLFRTGGGGLIDFVYIMDYIKPTGDVFTVVDEDNHAAAVNKVKEYVLSLEKEGLPHKEI